MGSFSLIHWLFIVVIMVAIFGPLLLVPFLVTWVAHRKSVKGPNLYPCPDCGRMVSRSATTCPQCGRPLQE